MQETDFVMYNMIRFLRDWMFMHSDEKKSEVPPWTSMTQSSGY